MSNQNTQNASAQKKSTTSFFPLYDFAKNIAHDKAGVSLLIPAGVEPHDWEPVQRIYKIHRMQIW